MLPATMKATLLTGHGGPEKLVWHEDVPVPSPGPDEVLVRVLAAGVNNTDINTRIGWYSKQVTGATGADIADRTIEAGGWSGALQFPRIQGGDLCGEVVSVGTGITGFKTGMRVTCAINQPEPTVENPLGFVSLGSEYDGAFAQYCCLPARHLHNVSRSPLTDIEIAAIPCAHGTAFNLLSRAGVGAGDHVLITGASGGVGMATVELAKILGATVTALSAPSKQLILLERGADHVMDRDAALAKHAYSAAIDVVGGDGFARIVDALKPGGRYATSGAIAGPLVELDLRTLYLNDITLLGCTYTPPEVFSRLVEMVNDGSIRPLVSATYPLADIHKAQADFISKKYPGKLVLVPPSG
ncbi:MAG: alcohol dehydrogenase family protein [Nitratireductor sp.]